MSKHAAPGHLQTGRRVLRGSFGQAVARTAVFNIAANGTAAIGGVILARATGPAVRGQYAAVTSWFGVALIVGDLGMSAALCYYVAREPDRAPGYVSTARAMMLTTGLGAFAAGMVLAPVLARSAPGATDAYRTAFAALVIALMAASYTFSLQATDLKRWNVVRLSQPAAGLAGICGLWLAGRLTLQTAIYVLAGSLLLQLAYAFWCSRRCGLTGGWPQRALMRPLAAYGIAQIAATAPAALNLQLDQLVLSQTVTAADLGQYAIAVSIATLPIPLVAAIGYVAFPSLAARRVVTSSSRKLQRTAVLASAGLATAMMAPIAASAYWVVPLVFGPGYRGAVPLLWLLAPGGIFLACGQVTGDLLRGRNRPAFVAVSQTLAAAFTVVLLIALLPVAGVAGAAIATTVAYGVALAAMLRCLWSLTRKQAAANLLSARPAATPAPSSPVP